MQPIAYNKTNQIIGLQTHAGEEEHGGDKRPAEEDADDRASDDELCNFPVHESPLTAYAGRSPLRTVTAVLRPRHTYSDFPRSKLRASQEFQRL